MHVKSLEQSLAPRTCSTNVSSAVPEPEDLRWVTFPPGLSTAGVGVGLGAFQPQLLIGITWETVKRSPDPVPTLEILI